MGEMRSGLMSPLVAFSLGSLQARVLMLIVFVLLMLGGAYVANTIISKKRERESAKALSEDTGTVHGADRGSDASHSDDWLRGVTANPGQRADMNAWNNTLMAVDTSDKIPEPEPEPTVTPFAQTQTVLPEAQQAGYSPDQPVMPPLTGTPGKHRGRWR